MSTSKRFLVGALLALVLMVAAIAPAAAATHIVYCFTWQGKEYCIKIPLQYQVFFKEPPYQKLEAVDISPVTHAFNELYRQNPESQAWLRAVVESPAGEAWTLVSPNGEFVVILDMGQHAAFEAEAEVGY